eukprot:jgi/Chrzof1/2915/Cz12g03240.t1
MYAASTWKADSRYLCCTPSGKQGSYSHAELVRPGLPEAPPVHHATEPYLTHHHAVCVQDELYLNGAVVLPHKEIKESVLQPNIIL